jgi:hypothetical protein
MGDDRCASRRSEDTHIYALSFGEWFGEGQLLIECEPSPTTCKLHVRVTTGLRERMDFSKLSCPYDD